MNFLDRMIGVFSPQWAVNRVFARATLQQIENLSGGKSGYEAGKLNINTRGRIRSEIKENAIPAEQISRLKAQSWNLWRNNPYARKIVRSLQSKVVGRGMMPESLATRDDGSPHTEFRARAKQLWSEIQSGFDLRGMPGRGGLTMSGLQKLALRSTILSGDVLTRLVPIEPAEQLQRDLPIPFVLQTIDSARLADEYAPPSGVLPDGHQLYRGVELDADGKRVAYWINRYRIGDTQPTYGTAVRIPAEQIGHLFVEEDIDQVCGTPWFASAILPTRDSGDLQYNVLKASAMAACVVMGYRKPTGATRFGLNASDERDQNSADGTDLTDPDGNAITKIQPGMFVNLGKDGALEGFSPNQPNTNAEAFIQHILRSVAASFPGVKSSTVTGDYRNSSFSSERSSDNDTWPEIEDVQDWFATSYCQPIYEAVIRAGILSGYFEGVVTAEEFGASPGRFTEAKWQGPISRSINPIDDVTAAAGRIKAGLSSPQMECAALNVNWMEVLRQISELYKYAEENKIPKEVINNILGITSQDVIAQSLNKQPSKSSKDPAKEDPQDEEKDNAEATEKTAKEAA